MQFNWLKVQDPNRTPRIFVIQNCIEKSSCSIASFFEVIGPIGLVEIFGRPLASWISIQIQIEPNWTPNSKNCLWLGPWTKTRPMNQNMAHKTNQIGPYISLIGPSRFFPTHQPKTSSIGPAIPNQVNPTQFGQGFDLIRMGSTWLGWWHHQVGDDIIRLENEVLVREKTCV